MKDIFPSLFKIVLVEVHISFLLLVIYITLQNCYGYIPMTSSPEPCLW